MEAKAPVLLVVMVETGQLRWFVGSIGLDGRTTPLLCSETGDLAHYREVAFDEQVAFLRHRFCGTLQRGCDRLWARNNKACRFVFVFESLLTEPTGELTRAVADHFTLWMLNPPVAVLISANGFAPGEGLQLEQLAGQLDDSQGCLLQTHLGKLLAARQDAGVWEMARKNGAWVARQEEGCE
jgi:hypothetical protein